MYCKKEQKWATLIVLDGGKGLSSYARKINNCSLHEMHELQRFHSRLATISHHQTETMLATKSSVAYVNSDNLTDQIIKFREKGTAKRSLLSVAESLRK